MVRFQNAIAIKSRGTHICNKFYINVNSIQIALYFKYICVYMCVNIYMCDHNTQKDLQIWGLCGNAVCFYLSVGVIPCLIHN